MSLFSIALVLFLIMDPIGNVATYLSMVKDIEPKRQTKIVIREMFIALFVMLLFNFIGEFLFVLLQISEPSVRLASGVILFLIALQIIFPHLTGIRDNLAKEEPFIIPFAIPLIAGPSLLTTIMLYAHMDNNQTTMFLAILIAWTGALIVLMSARSLFKYLGHNGLMACEKLMGMVLVMMAIQRFLDGVRQYIHTFGS